ncbi:MAG: CCC motif membrane protein [Bacteroidetes bacterium]|nr:CCC motif membrane protein [Bacteroidota bacterium]
MQPTNNQQNPNPENLPNAKLILLLGILSILLCWWHFISFAGIVLGAIALLMANREMKLYYSNPLDFTISSLNNVKAGRTCALIGLAISVIIFSFVLLMIFGILASLPFWGMIH